MTERDMLLKLLDCGENMRSAQKQYFVQKDKKIKQHLLGIAKQREIEFDNAIFNLKQLMK